MPNLTPITWKWDKDSDYRLFLDALIKAASEMNDEHYFRVPVARADDKSTAIFRERVYCYELYYYLRHYFEDSNGVFKLHGELDKKGHPIFPKDMKGIPDFLVHIPGIMKANLVAIEVKPVTVKVKALEKDVKKLVRFVTFEKGPYHRGIMLVYGNGRRKLPREFAEAVTEAAAKSADKIHLLWHAGPGTTPIDVALG